MRWKKRIYRDLVHNVDIIQKGDQYMYPNGKWTMVTDDMIGNLVYLSRHRRLDIRTMTIKEILNSND